MDERLVAEKVEQARDAVADSDADAWVIFCRETDEIHEPTLPYVLGFDVVWPTAVVVGAEDSTVILGQHDAPSAEELGVHEVRPYDESIREQLRAALSRISADTVAVNFDRDDNVADGLTHGMYLRLDDLLPDREFVGAGDIVADVRGLKSETEQERIDAAAETTLDLLHDAADEWTPDTTEAEVADYLHGRMREAGYEGAWSWEYCPTVHAGGAADVGHTLPGDRTVPEGELLHVDFGVVQDGYAADLQRLWVNGEPPEGLVEAFEDVRAAIEAGYEELEPGAVGHRVDARARAELVARDRDLFDHAFGHQVGRSAHDGGTLLGPEWERYGESVEGEVRPGEVYTMELGLDTEWGYVGQEEMVRVTEDGTEYVVDPQTSLRRLDE
ncbi:MULTISPECIES: M24 family metallopeptidase [Halolamina]|uniref:Xaa-Pro aminopeptidase n=1 Tax=Halolamina pelagica TaxID=699431 RepID=A0A1I5NPP4_9EURY|nr:MULTISPECIES: M24 family metallopeptidase [Halolamina]NHX36420.1 aminopeptidase P family protein [Halolamina sp. R1-12]SFP23785.1 Xaa-Pro aminopeptidase [Halolamina pelagica]